MQTTAIGTVMSSYITDSGKILVFNIEVHDPWPKKLTYQCVIEHSNMNAVRIGHAKLTQLVQACGLTHIMDSNELNGKKLFVTWDQDHADERRRSEITIVKPLPQAVPDAVAAPSPHEPSRAWRWASIATGCLWADFIRAPISALLGAALLAFAVFAFIQEAAGIAVVYLALGYQILDNRSRPVRSEEDDDD